MTATSGPTFARPRLAARTTLAARSSDLGRAPRVAAIRAFRKADAQLAWLRGGDLMNGHFDQIDHLVVGVGVLKKAA